MAGMLCECSRSAAGRGLALPPYQPVLRSDAMGQLPLDVLGALVHRRHRSVPEFSPRQDRTRARSLDDRACGPALTRARGGRSRPPVRGGGPCSPPHWPSPNGDLRLRASNRRDVLSPASCHSRHRQIDSCASTVPGWCGGSLRFRRALAGGLQCPMRHVRAREVKPAAVGADVWVGFAGSRKLGNAHATTIKADPPKRQPDWY